MSCFITLTQRDKRTLQINFQIQGYIPQTQLIRSRAYTFNKNLINKNSVTVSPKINPKSLKFTLKPIKNEFNFFKLQTSQKEQKEQLEQKLTKSTPKKQHKKLPSLDFSVSGFETKDAQVEDIFIYEYALKQ